MGLLEGGGGGGEVYHTHTDPDRRSSTWVSKTWFGESV